MISIVDHDHPRSLHRLSHRPFLILHGALQCLKSSSRAQIQQAPTYVTLRCSVGTQKDMSGSACGVGVLTMEDRNLWAHHREALKAQSVHNRAILKTINSALLVCGLLSCRFSIWAVREHSTTNLKG